MNASLRLYRKQGMVLTDTALRTMLYWPHPVSAKFSSFSTYILSSWAMVSTESTSFSTFKVMLLPSTEIQHTGTLTIARGNCSRRTRCDGTRCKPSCGADDVNLVSDLPA